METQNVTLSLPKKVLQKAKFIAVERNTSLSALLAGFIEEIVEQDEKYKEARARHQAVLEKGFDLGTVFWKRDELYDR